MIFDKADNYLFKIFSNQDMAEEFKLLCHTKRSSSLGGYLDNGDAYLLNKGKNKMGLRINDSEYSFIMQRRKFVISPEFQDIIENDEYFPEDEFRKIFKDVEYVKFIETEKKNSWTQEISYLVNKSSYVLLDYYNQFNESNYKSITLKPYHINGFSLSSLGLAKPDNEEFNIKDTPKHIIIVPNRHHELFDIAINNEQLETINLRRRLVQSIYDSVIEADKNSYVLKDDCGFCIETAKKNIENQNDSNDFDER